MVHRFSSSMGILLDNFGAKPLRTNELQARMVGPGGLRPCTHKIRPNVRFGPTATELPYASEMTRCANKRRTALQQNSSPSCQRRQILLLRFGIHLTLDDHRQRESKRAKPN
jgi:hypothetical protein